MVYKLLSAPEGVKVLTFKIEAIIFVFVIFCMIICWFLHLEQLIAVECHLIRVLALILFWLNPLSRTLLAQMVHFARNRLLVFIFQIALILSFIRNISKLVVNGHKGVCLFVLFLSATNLVVLFLGVLCIFLLSSLDLLGFLLFIITDFAFKIVRFFTSLMNALDLLFSGWKDFMLVGLILGKSRVNVDPFRLTKLDITFNIHKVAQHLCLVSLLVIVWVNPVLVNKCWLTWMYRHLLLHILVDEIALLRIGLCRLLRFVLAI